MTSRERILVLQQNRIEEHVISAILGLTEAEVSKTLSDPSYTPAETDVDVSGGEVTAAIKVETDRAKAAEKTLEEADKGLTKAEVEALIAAAVKVEKDRAVAAEGALDARLKAAEPPL